MSESLVLFCFILDKPAATSHFRAFRLSNSGTSMSQLEIRMNPQSEPSFSGDWVVKHPKTESSSPDRSPCHGPGPDCFRHYEMMIEGNIVLVPEEESMRTFMTGLPAFFLGG